MATWCSSYAGNNQYPASQGRSGNTPSRTGEFRGSSPRRRHHISIVLLDKAGRPLDPATVRAPAGPLTAAERAFAKALADSAVRVCRQRREATT